MTLDLLLQQLYLFAQQLPLVLQLVYLLVLKFHLIVFLINHCLIVRVLTRKDIDALLQLFVEVL